MTLLRDLQTESDLVKDLQTELNLFKVFGDSSDYVCEVITC